MKDQLDLDSPLKANSDIKWQRETCICDLGDLCNHSNFLKSSLVVWGWFCMMVLLLWWTNTYFLENEAKCIPSGQFLPSNCLCCNTIQTFSKFIIPFETKFLFCQFYDFSRFCTHSSSVKWCSNLNLDLAINSKRQAVDDALSKKILFKKLLFISYSNTMNLLIFSSKHR